MADETTAAPSQELPVEPPVDVANSEADVKNTTTDMEPPAPKRKGRPVGSKDTVKRTRKPPVQVRIEPLEVKPPEQPHVPTPKPEPEPTRVAEPAAASSLGCVKKTIEVEEEKTPRTLLRETSKHLISLRALVHDNRKAEHAKKYCQNWATWPLV